MAAGLTNAACWGTTSCCGWAPAAATVEPGGNQVRRRDRGGLRVRTEPGPGEQRAGRHLKDTGLRHVAERGTPEVEPLEHRLG